MNARQRRRERRRDIVQVVTMGRIEQAGGKLRLYANGVTITESLSLSRLDMRGASRGGAIILENKR